MARSDIFTLIPLDFWAITYGLDLYRFNQVNTPVPDGADSSCDPIWCQRAPGYGPNGRYHLRDALAEALIQAEQRVAEKLGSPVAPDWLMDEITWCSGPVETKRMRVIEFGRPLWTKIGDYGDYPVVYTDDWGRVTVPAADFTGNVCDLWLIAPGYPAPSVRKTYSIRPAQWVVDGPGDYVAKAHKAQFVVPALWEVCEPLDPDDPDTYISTVEVWEVKRGTGTAYAPAEILTYADTCEDICAEGQELSCVAAGGRFDLRAGLARGYIWPAEYDAATGKWSVKDLTCASTPYKARLYYKAGLRPENPLFCEPYLRSMAEAVARLATTYLAHAPCGCEAITQMFERDRMWMAADGSPHSSPADPHAYQNPFGNTWAAQEMYKLVRSIHPNDLVRGGAS